MGKILKGFARVLGSWFQQTEVDIPLAARTARTVRAARSKVCVVRRGSGVSPLCFKNRASEIKPVPSDLIQGIVARHVCNCLPHRMLVFAGDPGLGRSTTEP